MSSTSIDSGEVLFNRQQPIRQFIKRITIEDRYQYCVATADKSASIKSAAASDTDSTGDIKLYKAERKLIERMVLGNHLNTQGKDFAKSTFKVNNSSFLRPLPQGTISGNLSPTHSQLETPSTQYSAIVLSWRGRGAPPEKLHLKTVAASHPKLDLEDSALDELPFKRVWKDDGDRTITQRRFHWTKVFLYDGTPASADDTKLDSLWKSLQSETNETEFTLHHVPCKVELTELNLGNILLQFQWSSGSNLADQNHWRDILHAIHKHAFGGVAGFAHGQTIYEKLQEHADCPQGLERLDGQHHTLTLDAREELVPIRQNRPKYFLPSTSVADFMLQYFGSAEGVAAKLQDGSIQNILRGKLIQLKLDGAKTVKGIESVSPVMATSVADSHQHSAWRGKLGMVLRYPELPCINIGTKFRPALLPPEMAMLVPGQTSKRIQGPNAELHPEQSLNLSEAQHLFVDTDVARTKFKTMEMMPPSGQDYKSAISQLVKDSVDPSTRIIFVVPSASSVKTSLWKTFESSLRQTLLADSKKANAVAKPIVLSYQPGQDPVNLWRAQLIKAKNAGDGTPLAVVALENDGNHGFVYKTIKTLCEVDVGLQSVFMKLNIMQQKEDRHPGRGGLMTAKVIAKKVALRNLPPARTLRKDDPIDIAVALHIGQITVTAPKPKEDGGCTSGSDATKSLYVVTMSSRHKQESTMYRTSVKLLGPETVDEFALAEHVKSFVDALVTGVDEGIRHRVTILRSGFIPRSEDAEITDSSLRLLPEQVSSKHNGAVNGEKVDFTTTPNNNKMINSEVSQLVNAITSLLGSETSVSYVLLSEHNDFALQAGVKRKMEHIRSNGDHSGNETFFAVDMGREQTGDGFLGSHQNVHVTNNDKVICLTLLGHRLSDERVEKPQKSLKPEKPYESDESDESDDSETIRNILRGQKPSDSVQIAPSGSVVLQAGPRPVVDKSPTAKSTVDQPVVDKSEAVRQWQETLHARKNCITGTELNQLAHLWHDDRLGLSNTKWPVPTYLAHLATKRAQFHLTFDDFDGTSDTAPCKLRPVHDDVKDTLYFL